MSIINSELQDIAAKLEQATAVIQAGGVVAFPTDTFYGLGCDPLNATAIARLYEIKKRPTNNPIILLIADPSLLTKCVDFTSSSVCAKYKTLAELYWPGPLTIILPALPLLPQNLVSATGTIGVRFPQHRIATQLAASVGGLITATSANLSGYPSTVTAEEVFDQLGNTVDYIWPAAHCQGGQPSTIIDITTEPAQLLRIGAISRAKLAAQTFFELVEPPA
jgi:L-threonylcarbamoyladenylate synthase